MKIAVIGSGYVGLVTGACLAEAGHQINCIDSDKTKVSKLQNSLVPFYEPGLKSIVSNEQKNKRLNFFSSYKNSIKDIDVIFLCVGTPPMKNGNPNLKFLKQSLEAIAQNITKDVIIFIKSTVPVGTNKFAKSFYEKVSNNHLKATFASNPEFLKEGDAINDFKIPERIIIGTDSQNVQIVSKRIYKKFLNKKSTLQFVSIESAELIKYASNAFLATKISFINEIAKLSDAVGADIHEIQAGMGSDSRIGNKFLNAGLGFGGSCFPKDLDGLMLNFKNSNVNTRIAPAVKKVNSDQIKYFVKKIKLGINVNDSTFLFWGLSFKPETDDIRESVSIKLIEEIAKNAKMIYAYDPVCMKNTKKYLSNFKNIKLIDHQYQNIKKCDALILATEWDQFINPNLDQLNKLKSKKIFDGRNCLDANHLKSMDFHYVGIGKN